jgi:hypothetical protein
MHLGGTLFSDAAFKKILSIGYEFETSDLAKLSLHENKKTLVNSDLALRPLNDKIERGSIKVVDGNYLRVRIPIPKKGNPSISVEPPITEEDDEETLEFLRQMQEDEPEEYEREMQEKKERAAEALAKKENDSYLEYFNENRKTDNPHIVKFQVTNDLGDTVFGNMLKAHCSKLTIPKNDMFLFKTKRGKIYNFKFSEDIAKNEYCETFSGVEFVITYYNPKKDNANIILDTFVDACSRIVDHLGDLKRIQGTLLSNDDKKTHYVPIGVIDNERNLYRKPHTNLFYMDTYDNESTIKLKNYGDAEFIPQMTFRCKAADAVEVMKEILRERPDFKSGKQLIHTMKYDLACMNIVETAVINTIAKYNESTEHKIDLGTTIGQNIKSYMFLIYIKLYMFILHHANIISKTDYLKDHLVFASRHPNNELYDRIKHILNQHYNISDTEKLHSLLLDPESLKNLYEPPTEDLEDYDEDDFNDDGTYKYNDKAYIDDLESENENFGNPLYSMKSYFKYLDNKEEDWLKAKKFDVFSTTFDLKNDEILLENRSFRYAVELYLRNTVNFKVTKDALTVKDMHKIVNALYGKSIKRMMTLSRHPTKDRLTRKSKSKKAVSLKLAANQPMLAPIKEGSKEEDLSPEQQAPFEPIPLDLVPDEPLRKEVVVPIKPPSKSRHTKTKKIKPPRSSKSLRASRRQSQLA